MTKKETRKAAKQSILDGNTKQETFERLKQTSDLPAEDVAKIIKHIPSLQARKKYQAINYVLIVLLVITVLFKFLIGVPIVIEKGWHWFPILFILPIFNILMLWGVVVYSAGIHQAVAIITSVETIRSLPNYFGKPFSTLMVIDLIFAAALIALGLYLHFKLCPDYIEVKERYQNNQGQIKMRKAIKFEE